MSLHFETWVLRKDFFHTWGSADGVRDRDREAEGLGGD